MKPGEVYVWDNFRILHGTEYGNVNPGVCEEEYVEEQKLLDVWRGVLISRLVEIGMEEKWLVHVPEKLLREMINFLE